jgi:predicted RNA-binding protein with PIN domain
MSASMMIVDGYNVLLSGRHGGKADTLQQGRDLVLTQLHSFAAGKKIKVVVVFDGQRTVREAVAHMPAGTRVLFSKPPDTADHLIKRLVEKERQPARHVIVVTSDRAVAQYVRSCGSQHWTVDQFMQKLSEQRSSMDYDDKYRQGVSRQNLDEWCRLFGLTSSDDDAAAGDNSDGRNEA